jgi:hypothetical protein
MGLPGWLTFEKPCVFLWLFYDDYL